MAIAVKRKAMLTLLETLISMSIAMVLLTTLLYFYRQVDYINTLMDRSQNHIFSVSYLENRLINTIPKASAPSGQSKDKEFFFYTASDATGALFKEGTVSLVFTYDNGVDLNTKLSNKIVGRLFVDKEGNLILASWPLPTRWKDGDALEMLKEVLMEGVTGLAFEFFVAPEADRSKVTTKKDKKEGSVEPELKGAWVSSWRSEYEQLPSIVKVRVTYNKKDSAAKEQEKELLFLLPLPNNDKVIVYH